MALKRRKVEPTYASINAQCPNAVTNPKTDAPVHSNRVYKVIREDCYDNDPSSPSVSYTHLTLPTKRIV